MLCDASVCAGVIPKPGRRGNRARATLSHAQLPQDSTSSSLALAQRRKDRRDALLRARQNERRRWSATSRTFSSSRSCSASLDAARRHEPVDHGLGAQIVRVDDRRARELRPKEGRRPAALHRSRLVAARSERSHRRARWLVARVRRVRRPARPAFTCRAAGRAAHGLAPPSRLLALPPSPHSLHPPPPSSPSSPTSQLDSLDHRATAQGQASLSSPSSSR